MLEGTKLMSKNGFMVSQSHSILEFESHNISSCACSVVISLRDITTFIFHSYLAQFAIMNEIGSFADNVTISNEALASEMCSIITSIGQYFDMMSQFFSVQYSLLTINPYVELSDHSVRESLIINSKSSSSSSSSKCLISP